MLSEEQVFDIAARFLEPVDPEKLNGANLDKEGLFAKIVVCPPELLSIDEKRMVIEECDKAIQEYSEKVETDSPRVRFIWETKRDEFKEIKEFYQSF